MKIIGENKKYKPLKQVGDVVYFINSNGDRVPVVFNNQGFYESVTLTPNTRLISQGANVTSYNPKNSTGLQLWVKNGYGQELDGTNIDQWDDYSGANKHLTSASPNEPQVLNGSATFNRKGQYFSFDELTLTEFTVIIACTSEITKKQVHLGDSSDANMYLGTGFVLGYDYSVGFGAGNTYQDEGNTFYFQRRQLITYTRSTGNTLKVRHNGTEQWSASVSGNALTVDQVGRSGTSADTLGGEIHEILIYNKELYGAELKRIEDGVIKRNHIKV